MALDHALTEAVSLDEGVLRLYGWVRPTVSFGRNEPAAESYAVEDAHKRGIDFVRRPTGGRAVLHDQELTYAVAISERSLGGPRTTYRRINEALVRGLREFGVDAAAAAEAKPERPGAGPCFRVPTTGEVVAGDRKLVGSAQVRLRGRLLQHGSVLIGGDQAVLDALTARGDESTNAATLQDLVGEVRLEDVIAAVTSGFRFAFCGSWSRGEYRRSEIARAESLEHEIYTSDDWTWRR